MRVTVCNTNEEQETLKKAENHEGRGAVKIWLLTEREHVNTKGMVAPKTINFP